MPIRGRNYARDTAVLGLLTALLLGSKLAMAWLPNIEPVSLLIMVYAAVLGLRALLPIYAYVLLEYALWGFGLWSACYLYVWLVLALAACALRRMESPPGVGCAVGGLRAVLRGPVRADVSGRGGLGLRPELVGPGDSL